MGRSITKEVESTSSRKMEMKMDLLDPVMTDNLLLNIENTHDK